jgi:small-conductance mechanosensitive channel
MDTGRRPDLEPALPLDANGIEIDQARVFSPEAIPGRRRGGSRRILVLALAIGFFAVPIADGLGQEAPSETGQTETEVTEAPTPEAPTGPAAIPVDQIAAAAEDAANRLRDIRNGLETDPAVATVMEEIPRLVGRVGVQKTEPGATRPGSVPLRELQEIRILWSQYRGRFEEWKGVLEARGQQISGYRATLQEMRTVWELTRNTGLEEEIPEAVMDRIGSILEQIATLDDESAARRNELLTAQNRISEETTDIGEILDSIDSAAEEARQRLLSAESAPLWRALKSIRDEDSLVAQVGESLRQDAVSFGRFLEAYESRLPVQLVLFLVLLVPMAVLRRQSRIWAEKDDDLKPAAHLLGRPISAAFLVAILLTPWLYPDAPRIANQIAALASILPVLRLLPGLVHARFRAPLYGLVWLIILFLMHGLALEESILQRLIVFLVAALALGGFGWVLRPKGPTSSLGRGGWTWAAINLARLGMVLLAAALIANLLGNVSLAELLTRGVMGGAYIAVLLFTAVLVLDGFVTVLLRTPQARNLRMVRVHSDLLIHRFQTLIHLGALILWLSLVLPAFAILEPMKTAFSWILDQGFEVGHIDVTVGNVLAFIVALWLSIMISRTIRFVLQEDILSRIDLPRGVPATISMMIHYSIVTLGFLIALAAAGIELSQFALIFGALGVGIGFGLQSLVNNFVSGLILAFERPIQIGDTVEVGTLLGVVRRIGIRSSTVRTFEGAEVIVPNGNLISNEVINWTLSDRLRRVNVEVGVAYGTDPNHVIEILGAVVKNHENVLEHPSPDVLFMGFGDSSLNFLMRFWTARSEVWWTIRSEVTVAVNDALKENGIEIPFPQRDLHLRSVDPKVRKTVLGGPDSHE